MQVRYSYHHDPIETGRVITVARVVDGDTVKFGYAVCQPDRWVEQVNDPRLLVTAKIPGDKFSKKIGRDIAEGRLNVHPHSVVKKAPGEHPLDAIRRYFVESVRNGVRWPHFVQRTMNRHATQRPPTLLEQAV